MRKAVVFAVSGGLLLFCIRSDARDLVFLVTSDTHYGYEVPEVSNPAQITAMNNLPGKAYPLAIGGTVGTPAFVLVPGDLTDRDSYLTLSWYGPDGFLAQYGLDGTDGMLNYPVYEARGNHDKDNDDICGNCIRDSIIARHGDIYYSFNADAVHIVCLDDYPTAAMLDWLDSDLANMPDPCMPVILFHHRTFSSPALDSQRQYYMSIIGEYNIVALFYGHHHSSAHFIYDDPYSDAQYDTFLTDSPTRHPSPNYFYVVHITDDTMTVVENDWSGTGQWRNYYIKPVPLLSDTVIFTTAVDTMIAKGDPAADYSQSPSLWVDLSDSTLGDQPTEVLIRFANIFGGQAGQVRTNVNIVSAELKLNTTDLGDGATVHGMLVDWSDSDNWGTFGDDGIVAGVEAQVAPVAVVSGPLVGLTTIDVTDSLKQWQEAPASNYGWVLLPVGGNGWDFDSAQGSVPPRLVVKYEDEFAECDLYQDGQINLLDFAVLAREWRETGCGDCSGADLTGDGEVGLADLQKLSIYWLKQ